MYFLRTMRHKRKVLPKNIIGFDFVNFNNEHQAQELMNFNNLKYELSEKIYRFNEIRLKHLQRASKIILEYRSLEQEIWGG